MTNNFVAFGNDQLFPLSDLFYDGGILFPSIFMYVFCHVGTYELVCLLIEKYIYIIWAEVTNCLAPTVWLLYWLFPLAKQCDK